MKSYVYPKLPAQLTTPWIRFGGSGLANCMFVAARAFVKANRESRQFVDPAWVNFSIGPYRRGEADKRHYTGIFRHYGECKGVRKAFILWVLRRQVVIEEGLGNYFEDIIDDAPLIRSCFEKIIRPEIFNALASFDFSDTIAVHIRLGDYPQSRRVPMNWYSDLIEKINNLTQSQYRVLIFSDGTDDELKTLLALPNVQRVFFGNALGDIWALSKCRFLVGSDSTFSGWGAYLGQVPTVFFRKHYGRVLQNPLDELVEEEAESRDQVEAFLREKLCC